MNVNLYAMDGSKKEKVSLPDQFSEEIREDLIKKAVLAIHSHNRQPYGAFVKAGQRASAKISRRRRKFKGSYGIGISRVPRKSLWKRGKRFGWVGAFAPCTVGGRRAHPPKSEKIWSWVLNVKERRKAIRSALAATALAELVQKRGHKFKEFAFVVDGKVEDLNKTKDVEAFLTKLGLGQELIRIGQKKVRAGKGKIRGRRYQLKVGPLFVVSQSCKLIKSARNIAGVSVCLVKDLNVLALAPGGLMGRYTIFTKSALDVLAEKKLFTNQTQKKELKQ